ncbi:MAG: geranylgeranylglyceryl/heptaprenylglyceryl phosphate synthase [candidate division WOR-3 bacterium]
MPSSDTLRKLFSEDRDRGFFVLVDPDRLPRDNIPHLAERINAEERVKAILAGTSLMLSEDFPGFVRALREHMARPVIIFPGNSTQLAPDADGILLLSLISGRNPEFLIGEHVRAAPHIKRMGLYVVPTAYLLVESGGQTAVEFVSGTKPIPRDKIDILLAHIMAACLLGFKAIYLEAGSGASMPVPTEMIRAARDETRLPLLVGGGIRTPESAEAAFVAGADYVVVGTIVEEEGLFGL